MELGRIYKSDSNLDESSSRILSYKRTPAPPAFFLLQSIYISSVSVSATSPGTKLDIGIISASNSFGVFIFAISQISFFVKPKLFAISSVICTTPKSLPKSVATKANMIAKSIIFIKGLPESLSSFIL